MEGIFYLASPVSEPPGAERTPVSERRGVGGECSRISQGSGSCSDSGKVLWPREGWDMKVKFEKYINLIYLWKLLSLIALFIMMKLKTK